MDLGRSSEVLQRTPSHHAQREGCMRSAFRLNLTRSTDMVASMILCWAGRPLPQRYHELSSHLTSEQLATLPSPTTEQASALNIGAEFLPEEQVLALFGRPSMTFEVQFEMRCGRLQRLVMSTKKAKTRCHESPELVWPTILLIIISKQWLTKLRQFRNIAVDRVSCSPLCSSPNGISGRRGRMSSQIEFQFL